MGKNTSFSVGEHFESFIAEQVASGRYGSGSDVMRAALRTLERDEREREAIRQALIEGELSGIARGYSVDALLSELKASAAL